MKIIQELAQELPRGPSLKLFRSIRAVYIAPHAESAAVYLLCPLFGRKSRAERAVAAAHVQRGGGEVRVSRWFRRMCFRGRYYACE